MLSFLFNPESVAVIGASRVPGKVGHDILKNVAGSFKGKVYPVNPKATEIEGLRCYSKISETDAELAIIALPAKLVPGIAEECGDAGVKGLIVVSAGFREVGEKGARLERQLLEVSRKHGMRLLGPNCLGLIDSSTPLNASFAGKMPAKGSTAFISQSGALCTGILDWSLSNGLGFSKFVSLGNKADLDEVDFLQAFMGDASTKAIVGYVESITDGEKFLEVAQRVARKKPVALLKSGISEGGARAASSHTGALAGSDEAYDQAFRQSGIIRAASIRELFDLAKIFQATAKSGDKIGVITNAGGVGIVASDSVETHGLRISRFGRRTAEALKSTLPPEAGVYNPVDILGDAGADRYAFALEKVLADPGVDTALVILTPQAMTEPVEIARAIAKAKTGFPKKLVVTVFLGGEDVKKGSRLLREKGIPCYQFPEEAVAAIAGLAKRKFSKAGALPRFKVDKHKVTDILKRVREENRRVLLGVEAAGVAGAYGIPVVQSALAVSPEEAVERAEKIGYPVVLKVSSPRIVHKTDIKGVKLNIMNSAEVKTAFVEVLENAHRYMPRTRVYGVEVQKMVTPGREIIVGMNRDLQFGPMVMFGLGGVYANLLEDVSFRLVKGLDTRGIRAMIEETKAYKLLRGYRGEEPGDATAVSGVIARIARLAEDFPNVLELDINPLFVYKKGCLALDVKITIA